MFKLNYYLNNFSEQMKFDTELKMFYLENETIKPFLKQDQIEFENEIIEHQGFEMVWTVESDLYLKAYSPYVINGELFTGWFYVEAKVSGRVGRKENRVYFESTELSEQELDDFIRDGVINEDK